MNFAYGTETKNIWPDKQSSLMEKSEEDDSKIGIQPSEDGWDSIHLAYPCVIRTKDKTYMFYNEQYGLHGFGLQSLTMG